MINEKLLLELRGWGLVGQPVLLHRPFRALRGLLYPGICMHTKQQPEETDSRLSFHPVYYIFHYPQ